VSAWSYDAIANVYATDMGRSMPFDDIGWYRGVCLAHGGRALELGCGTGRILIELAAAGVDVVGVDRSLPMLQRLAADALARGLPAPPLAQMDLRALALDARFDVMLLPYSLVTYLVDPADAARVLAQLRALAADDARLVIDAFIPQPVASFADFRLDYRRPHGDGTLERFKRIAANADGTNRIERRYRVLDAHYAPVEEFTTDETVRPYTPEAMAELAAATGWHVHETAWDYGTSAERAGAKFASLVLR
jgi:SAM-dependent methyltransferase